jgi:hypothetical protein
MDDQIIERINTIYPLLADSILYQEREEQMIQLIKEFKVKFEGQILNTHKGNN